MRKLLFLFCSLLCLSVFSQDLITKKGESILPEQGDWSIGTTAHPLINFIKENQ